MNWDAMMVCGAKRAMGNNTANKPINPYKPDVNAWLDGWADVLDVINSHSQALSHHFCMLISHFPQAQTFLQHAAHPAGAETTTGLPAALWCQSLELQQTYHCGPLRAQAMAKLAGVKLSKAALSHVQVPRPRFDSPLLPDTAVQVDLHIACL